MDDAEREAWIARHARRPPNPLFKPGEGLPLEKILEVIPPADENLLRDVDDAQRGPHPRR